MDNNDRLERLFARMRDSKPYPDPDSVSPAFETRLMSRMGAQDSLSALWMRGWSVAFGTAAAVLIMLTVIHFQDAVVSLALQSLSGEWFMLLAP